MSIDARDRHLIEDALARWCWLMDGGKGDEWASLWTSDGVFTGIPETATGAAQLRLLPVEFHQMGGGKFRHAMANITLDEGHSADEIVANAYSLLTNWNDGGSLMGFAMARFTFVRQGADWKIKALHASSQG